MAPSELRNVARRALALRDIARAGGALRALMEMGGGAEVADLEVAVDHFGELAPVDGLPGPEPLFSPTASLEDKLLRVVSYAPPALSLADGIPERRLFTVMDAAGLRLPYCQFPIEIYRADYAYPEWRAVIEVDDPSHRWQRDAHRDRVLPRHGWLTHRIDVAELEAMSNQQIAHHLVDLLSPFAAALHSNVVLAREKFSRFVDPESGDHARLVGIPDVPRWRYSWSGDEQEAPRAELAPPDTQNDEGWAAFGGPDVDRELSDDEWFPNMGGHG